MCRRRHIECMALAKQQRPLEFYASAKYWSLVATQGSLGATDIDMQCTSCSPSCTNDKLWYATYTKHQISPQDIAMQDGRGPLQGTPCAGKLPAPVWRTKDSGGRYYSRPCEGLEGSGTFLGVVGAVTRLDGLHIHTHCASDEAASGESEGGEGGPRREGPEGVHGSLTGAVLWHAWKGPRVLCQAFRLFKEGKGQAFAALPVLFSHA